MDVLIIWIAAELGSAMCYPQTCFEKIQYSVVVEEVKVETEYVEIKEEEAINETE